MNELACPRCRTLNPGTARFCRRCGLALVTGPDGVLGAGRIAHPDPLPVPPGFQAVTQATSLYFRYEAAWGGAILLGTEALTLRLFNGGYSLARVRLGIRGEDETGRSVFALDREIEAWPRGEHVALEIASWELAGPAQRLTVVLVSAEFAADS